jgi:hypothetical protein
MFPRGQHLWAGLTSIHNYIEYYGTGGGLTRPLYSETLTEAARLLDRPGLRQLAKDYAALGRAWTTLAETALPSRVPEFKQAARLMARREELLQSGPEGREDAASTWEQLAALVTEVARNFPLTEAESAALRQELQAQVRAIHEEEERLAVALQESLR